jgi:hypothetical protein
MVLPGSRRVSRAPRYSGIRFESVWFSLTWLSHSLAGLSRPLRLTNGLVTLLLRTLQPPALHAKHNSTLSTAKSADYAPRAALGLGSSDFARRYFRNHYCFLFLQVLRWFTSLGSLSPPMNSAENCRCSTGRVSPFGNPRINACLQLPEAYRSLPRPSSPTCAKASTVRP